MQRPQQHLTPWELIAHMATSFHLTSSRSGSMMNVPFTPQFHVSHFRGPQSIQGRIRHAGEVRRIKQAQRRRNHLKSLRS